MAQFPRAPIIGNFKPSKLVQLKEKAKDQAPAKANPVATKKHPKKQSKVKAP